MKCWLLCLCLCFLVLQANGYSQYYVKPTEPVNSSCPGQPCLTLAQYNIGNYFFSNNNPIFTFMSGVHTISTPVYVDNSFNVTFKSCRGCDETVTVVHNSTRYCFDNHSIVCYAFVFHTIKNLVFKDIKIAVVQFNQTSWTYGIVFILCTNVSLDSVPIVITDVRGNINQTEECSYCVALMLFYSRKATLDQVHFNMGSLAINSSQNIIANTITVGNFKVSRNSQNITVRDISITGSIIIEKTKNMEITNLKWKIKSALGAHISDSDSIFIHNITITHERFTGSIIKIFRSDVIVNDTIFSGFTGVLKHQLHDTEREAIIRVQRSTIHFHNCTFSNNNISSILILTSNLIFSGFVTFLNNTAYKGACLTLYEESYISFVNHSYVSFADNHALIAGGVFYAETYQENCMFQLDERVNLKFRNNSAGMGGDLFFLWNLIASNTYCLYNVFEHHSEIYPNDTLSTVSSSPTRVCVCDSTGHPDCLKVFMNFTVYPGQTISLRAVVTGQNFGTHTGQIYTQFLNSQNATMDQYQYSQYAKQTQCNQLRYSIFSLPTENNVLSLTTIELPQVHIITNDTVENAFNSYSSMIYSGHDDGNRDIFYFPVQINITVLQCPIGFTLSQPPYRCICDPHLTNLPGAKCYLETLSFKRSGLLWIALEDNTTVIVSEECRFFLCEESEIDVTVTDADDQCNFNHSGTLCGSCQEGLSLALGSQQCLHCSNKYLALLVPFAVAGIVLVFAIKILDITVATGYVNGLVLYFTTIHTVWFVLQNPQNRNPILAAIVAWSNLDLGIETCFFDGLTPYWKTWLQFLFPLYLWAISRAMILLAKNSRRMTRIMGSNPVSFLATIFLLSYTKLLRTCTSIMFYSTVVCPNTTKTVWAVDAV